VAIRTILVPLDGSDASAAVLDAALVVANRFGAHIDALHVRQRPEDAAPYLFTHVSGKLRESFIREAEKTERDKAAAVRAQFEEFCTRNAVQVVTGPPARHGATAAWREEPGRAAEVLVRCARLADVVAIARPRTRPEVVRRSPIGQNLEAVMLGSGRPVLIVPPGWQAKRVEHAAIGWNESLEASRALAMTMPWLEQMSAVTVIASGKRRKSAARLGEYLAWHGVEAKIRILDQSSDSVGKSMLDTCAAIGAELLVVGGYSRARTRQLMFGGVTQHLLKHSNIITVMVH